MEERWREVKKRRWRRERCLALTETDWPSATVSKTSRPCPSALLLPAPVTPPFLLCTRVTEMLCALRGQQHRQRHSQFLSSQHTSSDLIWCYSTRNKWRPNDKSLDQTAAAATAQSNILIKRISAGPDRAGGEREGLLFCFVLLLLCVYIYSRIWLAHHHSLSLLRSVRMWQLVKSTREKSRGGGGGGQAGSARRSHSLHFSPLSLCLSLCSVGRKTHRGSVCIL